jgi:hypothetical protein
MIMTYVPMTFSDRHDHAGSVDELVSWLQVTETPGDGV